MAEARQPHPSTVAETTLRDLEVKGWRLVWDEPGNVLLVTCPEGKFTYRWPASLNPGWRWDGHFKRMMAEHRRACT